MRSPSKVLVTGTLLLIGSVSAKASDLPTCDDQTLFMENEEIVFVGDDQNQADAGDRRVLRWRVYDADNNDVGVFHIVTTVLTGGDAGDIATADGTLVFPNGNIHATVTTVHPDASDTTQTSRGIHDWSIIGGNGDFTHARGVIDATPPQDSEDGLSNWTIDIQLSCPE